MGAVPTLPQCAFMVWWSVRGSTGGTEFVTIDEGKGVRRARARVCVCGRLKINHIYPKLSPEWVGEHKSVTVLVLSNRIFCDFMCLVSWCLIKHCMRLHGVVLG